MCLLGRCPRLVWDAPSALIHGDRPVTWKDDDGTLYGIYHYEPDNVCSGNSHLPTAPKIGWLRSIDNGLSWSDLGFVLAADPADFRCDTKSPWDAGGEGDFSVMLDHQKEYFYIFFSG